MSLILPASTVPLDVTLATRYLETGDLDEVDYQPWDESVIGLTRYPDVLAWMDENLEWTASVGEAFYVQPEDVMASIQRLRDDAREVGSLVNTPQQTVIVEQEVIRIVPTDPEVIYVPVYDPQVVYVETYQPDYVGNAISFGAGFAVGTWLSYDFDWNRREFYYGPGYGYNNRDYWYDRGSYDRDRNVNISETNTNISNVNTITNVDNRNIDNRTINRWAAQRAKHAADQSAPTQQRRQCPHRPRRQRETRRREQK